MIVEIRVSVPKHKVVRTPEFREVRYSEDRWELLRKFRRDALELMEKLITCGFNPIVHGSIARGDVGPDSDIDVVIPYTVKPYEVELCLEMSNLKPTSKYIVQATPASTPKAYIELDPKGLKNISFPLEDLSPREYEFYLFGGLLNLKDLIRGVRVPGVNKQLVLIIPRDYGHDELPVVGYEGYVARVVRVSLETVKERVEVLSRRDEFGRTGVYLKYVLRPDETFDEALRTLIKSRKTLKRV